MKLPRYIASTPAQGTGLVKARDIGALTKRRGVPTYKALSSVASAVQSVGKIGYEIYMHKRAVDDSNTMGEADIMAGDAVSAGVTNMNKPDPPMAVSGETDTSTALDRNIANLNGEKKIYADKINELAAKIKDPARRAKWKATRLKDGNAKIDHANNLKFNNSQVSQAVELGKLYAGQGDIDAANTQIDMLLEHGRIYESQAVKYKEDNLITMIQSQIIADPAGMISNLKAELDVRGKGKATDEYSDIDNMQLNDMLGYAITAKNRQDSTIETTNKEKISALYKKEDEGSSLDRSDFIDAYVDPDKADQHYDEYVRGQVAKQNGEVNFIKEGDPVVLANINARIDLKPENITEKELYEEWVFPHYDENGKFVHNGVGTSNITALVNRLRTAQEGVYAPAQKYKTQLSTLYNAGFFGDKKDVDAATTINTLQRKMAEYIKSQDPSEEQADNYYARLIVGDFKGFGSGGWEEKGFKHTYTNDKGEKIENRFRYGDIKTVDGVEYYYAGTDDDSGEALWTQRQ